MENILLSKTTMGNITLKNRMVMAPMTRNRAPESLVTPLMIEYYRQRSSAGLIITEGAQISTQAVGYPATPGIYNQAQIDSWQPLTDRVHQADSHIYVQLWHCGRISHPDFHDGEAPVAPSAIKPEGQAFTYEGLKDFVTPRALKLEEIAGIIEQYRQAAANAIKAGFDGVEIHAANGYLLDQFLRDGSNQRGDAYGGSLENRSRLILEVTQAVCDEIGASRVGVRISPINAFNDMHDSTPQLTFTHIAAELSTLKLAYLHVVEVSMTGESSVDCDMHIIRQAFDGLYIANGGYDKARGNDVITKGHADLVAYGIPFLANPDLPERMRLDAALNQPDQASFYGGDEHGYTDYPFLD